MLRRCVGSSGAEDPAAKTSLVASTRLSDRPTLPLDQGVGSSGAEDFVLVCLCLDSNLASDRPTVSSLRPSDHLVLLSLLLFLRNSSAHLQNGPLVHPMVPTSFCLLRGVPNTLTLCTDGTIGSSDDVLSFSFLSCFWPLKNRLSFQFDMSYFCILGT
jgi:hypothetical protein